MKGNKQKGYRGITEQQEAYCVNYVYYTGMDGIEAVKLAYNFTGDEEHIYANARRHYYTLMKMPNIKRRINQLVEERNGELIVDRRYVIDKLKRLAEQAQRDSDKVRALELLGKSMGMFTDKQVVETNKTAGTRVKEALKKRLKPEEQMPTQTDKVIEFPVNENESDSSEVANEG